MDQFARIVIGYHGCKEEFARDLLLGVQPIHTWRPSTNDWDWLGHGIYFWEASPERGLQFAREAKIRKKISKGRIHHPYVLGAVIEPVLQGTCQIGIVGSLPTLPETMHSELLLDVPLVTVVAPTHPLAKYKGVVPQSELQRHVQLVLTDRSTLSKGQSYGVFSKNAWRLADMGARHAFLCAGFGFGNMPRFMVEDDIASGRLCVIRIELPTNLKPLMPMRAVYRTDAPPGPAGRWLIDHLNGSSRARRKN